MKRTGNKNLKIISATLMAIFSLMACFTATYAWFAAQRKADNGADAFKVEGYSEKLKQITFHEMVSKSVGNTYAESTFRFNKEATGKIEYNPNTKQYTKTGNTNIALDNYDALEHEQPLLLIIELSDEYGSNSNDGVVIAASTQSDDQVFIGERVIDEDNEQSPAYSLDDPDHVLDVIDGKTYYGFSNAVGFYANSYTEDSFDDAFSSTSTYNLTNLNNRKSFVNINNYDDSSTFTNHISPIISATGGIKYVTIVIDYYADAIEYIYSTFLGNTTLEDDYEGWLYFLCDWSLEVY